MGLLWARRFFEAVAGHAGTEPTWF